MQLRDTSTRQVAHILHDCLSTEALARVIDGLLCADAEGSLTDHDAKIAERLFDRLTELNPAAVELAQRGIHE